MDTRGTAFLNISKVKFVLGKAMDMKNNIFEIKTKKYDSYFENGKPVYVARTTICFEDDKGRFFN